MKNKKGQAMVGIIFSLIVIGILVGVAFISLDELRNNIDKAAGTRTNETGAWINNTPYTVNAQSLAGFGELVITEARNGSSGLVITSGNYTVNATAGTIVNATAVHYSSVQLDYTFKYYNDAQTGVTTTITATKKIPQFLGIIVLVAVIGIVLFLLFRFMPKSQGETF